jgi:hypothetical protein
MSAVHATTFTYAQSINFYSDSMRIALREIIREHGLDPHLLMQDWDTIERGIRAWAKSQDLEKITIEFFQPGSRVAAARWDFPVQYVGSGLGSEMWLDKAYLKQLIAKAPRPPGGSTYRILLGVKPGAGLVDGFVSVTCLDTGSLVSRAAGTAIATGHLTGSVTYWK